VAIAGAFEVTVVLRALRCETTVLANVVLPGLMSVWKYWSSEQDL